MSDPTLSAFHTHTVSGNSHNSFKIQGNSSSEKLGNFPKATWLESGKAESVT